MALNDDLKRELQELAEKTQALLDEFERTRVNVALIGEPGVGKSSLMNAIVGRKVAETGPTGETTLVPQGVPHDEIEGMVFWDLPGCGTPNHPRETYIEDQRLLTDYDLFILVTEKRVRQGDEWLYRKLRKEAGRPFFVVRTHFDQVVDELEESEARALIQADIRKQLGESDELPVYIVALKGTHSYDLGRLIEDIIDSLSGVKQEKAALAVAPLTEEILRKKRLAAQKIVSGYALVSAANGFNPIPGLDISVDVGLLAVMADKVVTAYGLKEDQLNFIARRKRTVGTMTLLRKIIQPLTEYLAKEGVVMVLKRVGAGIGAKAASKWFPLVGQAIASYLGYKLTVSFGMSLIDDCEKAMDAVQKVLRDSTESRGAGLLDEPSEKVIANG